MRTRSYKRTLKPQVPAEKAPAHSSHPLSSSESLRAPRWSPRYLQHQRVWLWLDNDSYVKAGAFSRMFSHATESARPSLRTTYRKTKWTSCSRRQPLTYATVKSKIQSSKLSTSSFKQNISKRGKLWGKRQKLYSFKFLQIVLAQSLKVITFSSCTPHCDLEQVRRLIAWALGPSSTFFCEYEPHTSNWKVIVRKDQRAMNETHTKKLLKMI